MNLVYVSLVLFALAALIGIYLITQVFQGKLPSKAVALTHGGLAATALVLLIVHTFRTGADLTDVIILFIIAALGGIALFVRHVTGKSLPRGLALVHALIAVTALVFLLVHSFGK